MAYIIMLCNYAYRANSLDQMSLVLYVNQLRMLIIVQYISTCTAVYIMLYKIFALCITCSCSDIPVSQD